MEKLPFRLCLVLVLLVGWQAKYSFGRSANDAQAPLSETQTWKFAVSGDSRDCGDVVMPGIAAAVKQSGSMFYWHMGDFRKIEDFDEDMQHEPRNLSHPMSIGGYENSAWDDFIENEIKPFAPVPVYLGIGNHDTTFPKTREQYLIQFANWLDMPALEAQRLRDNPRAFKLKAYYHWIIDEIDFITLDNATPDQFDSEQIAWLEGVLRADTNNPQIRTIVAGMHEALPESISRDHSMNQSEDGTESGHRIYADLLKAQNEAHKRVYVLASHSHYFMDGIFNTDYWRHHGGILPGWIIGTAGAQRYALPKESSDARAAETNVYGFLLATVHPGGEIDFAFQRLKESDVPAEIVQRYTQAFVHWCFAENSVAH